MSRPEAGPAKYTIPRDGIRVPGRTEAAQVTLLNKNWGLGIEFAAVAHVVYQRAKAAGAGRPLPGEWFSQFSHP